MIHCSEEVPQLLSTPVCSILGAIARGKENMFFFDSMIYLTKIQLCVQLNTEAHLKQLDQASSKVEAGTDHFESSTLGK